MNLNILIYSWTTKIYWCIFCKDDSEDEVNQSTTSSHAYQEDESGSGSGSSRRHEGNSLDSTANISVLTETGFAEASSFLDRSMVMSRTLLSFLFGTYV